MKKRYCGRVPLRMVTMPLAACANARFTVTWGGWAFTVLFFLLRLIKIEKDWMSRDWSFLVQGGIEAKFEA